MSSPRTLVPPEVADRVRPTDASLLLSVRGFSWPSCSASCGCSRLGGFRG